MRAGRRRWEIIQGEWVLYRWWDAQIHRKQPHSRYPTVRNRRRYQLGHPYNQNQRCGSQRHAWCVWTAGRTHMQSCRVTRGLLVRPRLQCNTFNSIIYVKCTKYICVCKWDWVWHGKHAHFLLTANWFFATSSLDKFRASQTVPPFYRIPTE